MRPQAQTIEELVTRALAPYDQRPNAEGVAHLTDDLITAGQELHDEVSRIPAAERTERASASLGEWAYFAAAGAMGHGDHANWHYARGLARIIRNLWSTLDQQRPASAR